MAKKPVKQKEFPTWWHPSGAKLRVEPHSSWPPISLVLKSDSAGLIIEKAWDWHKAWHFIWVITHSLAEHSDGNIWMTIEQLDEAFGDSAFSTAEGLFIRQGPYLNIPGPGTGKDGDPNISILVTKEIRRAVQRLLQWRTKPSEEPETQAAR